MKKVFCIITFMIIAGTINAQSIALGVQGAYVKSKDTDGVIMPAAAVRVGLGGLRVEGSVGYKADKYFDGMVKTTTYPVLLTGFLNILPIVHIEGGIGWYNTKIEYSGLFAGTASETSREIGYHAGAGVEIPLGNLILTGDIRYVVEKTRLENIRSTGDLNSDFYMIVVGLMFKLY